MSNKRCPNRPPSLLDPLLWCEGIASISLRVFNRRQSFHDCQPRLLRLHILPRLILDDLPGIRLVILPQPVDVLNNRLPLAVRQEPPTGLRNVLEAFPEMIRKRLRSGPGVAS